MAGIFLKDRLVVTWVTQGILPLLLEQRNYSILILKGLSNRDLALLEKVAP